MVTTQIITKRFPSLTKAISYFSILSAVSGVHLTPMEIKLLAFISINGTISKGGAKEHFIELFPMAKAGIPNLTLSLIKKGMLVREKPSKKIRINPSLLLDFSGDIILKIKLLSEE